MSESENSSDDSYHSRNYYFLTHALSDDRNNLTSIEYIQTFILYVERDLQSYVYEESYEIRKKSAYSFDEILKIIFEKKEHRSHKIESYDTIYNNAIFGFNYHQEEELLLCGLRFLYSFPNYFIETGSENRDTLINILIQLILTKEEPVPTHAIKCLLIAAYIFTYKRLKITSFKLLIDILMKRISAMLEFNDPDILITVSELDHHKKEVELLYFDESLNRLVDKKLNEFQIEYCDPIDYLEEGATINGNMQIFFYMSLLKSMIYHVDLTKLIENVLFWDLLYSCINVTICKIDNVIILAFEIILNLLENHDFLCQFIKTNGVERICCFPHCLTSSPYASLILSKIIENTSFCKNLIKNNLNLIIHYGMSFFGCLNPKKSCNIIISLFCDREYYEIFINQKGIKLILENVNKNEAFVYMKNVDSSYQKINLEYMNILEEIKKIIILLLLHIFIQILSVTPIKIINSIIDIKFDKINYKSYDILVEYWENEGGFKHKIEFFEELLEVEKLEVVVSILRMTCQYSFEPFKLEIYKNLMYFLKFMSLYHRSKALFIHSFDPYPKQFKKGNSLVVFFGSITEQNFDISFIDFEFILFQVYHNLLVSCFTNFKTYKRVLKLKYYFNINEHDNDTFGLQTDETSNLFMDSLINNNLVYHILKNLPNMILNVSLKIYAIKCLLMLLTRKLSIQIISVIQGNFISKFIRSLNLIINSEDSNTEIKIFLIHSISLIYKLHRYTNFKSINNVSFSASTNDDLNKTRRLKNLLRNDENCLGKIHRPNFLIFKDCIDSIKNNELSSQKLKLCFELIHRLFPINFFSEVHFKSSKIYLSYDYGINVQKSTCIKNGLKYNTRFNSKETIYKKFNKITNFIDKMDNERIFDAKLLIDDKIVYTSSGGISHTSPNCETYSESSEEIYYINDSYNGEFIIGCGISDSSESRFTNIWKYNPLSSQKFIKPKNIYEDMYYSRMTNDNFNIFAIAKNLTAKMIDIETASIVKKFYNNNFTSYPSINSSEISDDYNLLLFNGDLFCTRSGKLIYSFPNFNQHISGIFINSETRILINCELWDLRTTKLVDQINDLENFIIKKTYNDDILLAIEKCPYYNVCHMGDHLYKWRVHFEIYGGKLKLYNINTFSSMSTFLNTKPFLEDIDSKEDIAFANISRDCTKIIFGEVEENHGGASSSFKLISIGDKTHTSSD